MKIVKNLSLLKNDWNRCIDETDTIFQTYEWISTWWNIFGKDKDLFLLVIEQDNRVAGIAPLMMRKKKLEFIGSPLSDYNDFISKDSSISSQIIAHLKNEKAWNNIILEELPSTSNIFRNGFFGYHNSYFCNETYRLKFSKIENINSFIKKRDISRRKKSLEEKGKVKCTKCGSVSAAMKNLDIMFEQHIKQWKKKGIRSMFESESHKKFIKQITKKISKKIDIWTLTLDKKPIAVKFGFNFNKVFLEYCQSYDLEYKKYSPSSILYTYLFKYYYLQGYHFFDFSRGGESYKKRFANHKQTNLGLSMHRKYPSYEYYKFYNLFKEKVMRRPRLHQTLHKYKAKFK